MLRWKILGLILLLPAMAAQAEIYRSVDAKGNVLFSDVPAPKAERVRLPPLSIIPGMSPEDMARANGSNDSPTIRLKLRSIQIRHWPVVTKSACRSMVRH
jgi:hypothetical protein